MAMVASSCTSALVRSVKEAIWKINKGMYYCGIRHDGEFHSSFHVLEEIFTLLSFSQLGSMHLSLKRKHAPLQSVAIHSQNDVVTTQKEQNQNFAIYLRDKKIIPVADPPSMKDMDLLFQFVDQSRKLMVLTGAGMSTESGIPDYRSPNGAYSTGFKPITHQEFVRSNRARRRYWARSYAGWRRFTAAQPSAAHFALASLEKVGRINFMITQNVDRLHHRAGSSPLELHGSVYSVVCLQCGTSICRNTFQDQVKVLNPKWSSAIESLESGNPGSDKSFGMQQRPDGDIEIDEKYWEEDFHIPNCHQCGGMLKPDVVFFGDNVPKDRADKAMKAAKECDAFLVLGSSLMTMSAFRLVRAASDAKAALAIVNIGETRADDLVSLKINARCGEILPRLFEMGSIAIPTKY